MFRKILFIIFSALVLNSCHQKRETPALLESAKEESPTPLLITKEGDTIPTGIRLPHQGVQINTDSITKARTVALKGTPEVVPAHLNVHTAGRPKIVEIPGNLKVFTPGKDGLSLPKAIPVEGVVVPAGHQKPVVVLPPRKRDNARYNIRYWNDEQGINANVTSAILEDSRGHLWFGTRGNGVFRFDGQQATHFTTDEGLITNLVLFILEDSKGNIWFGGREGVCYYDGQQFIQFPREAGFTRITFAAMEDRHSNLWFGTLNGVIRFDGKTITHFTANEGLCNQGVSSILEDRDGNLWFGTRGAGAICYDGERFIHYTTKEGLCFDFINVITEDHLGQLWLGTGAEGVMGRGVSKFDGRRFTSYSTAEGLSGNRIQAIAEDGQGDLWFGTYGGGVTRFDGQVFTHYTEEEGLSSNNILSMFMDSRGIFWLGTNGGGINRLDSRSFSFFSKNEGLNRNLVQSLAEDSLGNLWIGSRGEVVRYDGQNFTHFTEKEGLEGDAVSSILVDHTGGLWLGTYDNGAIFFETNKNRGSFTYYNMEEGLGLYYVHSIRKDHQGNVWFVTGTGVDMLEKYPEEGSEKAGFVHFSLDAVPGINWIQCMLEDSQHHLWLGRSSSSAGSSRLELPRGTTSGFITHIGKKEGLYLRHVKSIIEGRNGHLWFGGGGGVMFYDGQEFHTVEIESDFSNFEVRSLTEDIEGNIWVAAVDQIAVILKKEISIAAGQQDSYKIMSFRKPDGIPMSGFITSLLDSKNRLWLGGKEGLAMIDLNHFDLPKHAPGNVTLTHIDIGQQFVNYRGLADTAYAGSLSFGPTLSHSFDSVAGFFNYPVNLNLPYDLNHLTFHFSAIDWASPNQIKYSYLLEGIDKEWSIPQEESKADYRNIHPGTYTFKVKAIGITGEWSEPFSYTFSIQPPWWQTIWAYAFYLALILAAAYLFYGYQKRQWQLQTELALERKEAERLKELNELKTRLYTNITHEFRTPLTIILGMADQIKSNPENWYNEGLKMIKRSGSNLLRLVNQMLDFSKVEAGTMSVNWEYGDLIPYLKYLFESFQSQAHSKGIDLTFSTDPEAIQMDYDPEKLQQIVSNLISNAIKFTPNGGTICMKVGSLYRAESEFLELRITDTGIGIPEDKLPLIFDRFYQVEHDSTINSGGTGIGLALTKELVNLLEGNITVQSTVGVGTEFRVSLPIHRKAEPAQNSTVLFAEEEALPFIAVPSEDIKYGVNDKEKPLLLIIEDNPDVVQYLKACLQNEYQLVVAYDGKNGIHKALELIPDVIISDVMMPEKNGFEVCETLKQDIRTSHIPIILLTAKADMDSRIKGLKCGADAYLAKPFNREELSVRLQKTTELRERLRKKYRTSARQENIPFNDLPLEDAFMQKVHQKIEENFVDEHFGVPEIYKNIGMSRPQFYRKFKALTGQQPSIYLRTFRLHKAKGLLQQSQLSISEVAYQVGFRDPAYFSRVFKEEFGIPPREISYDKHSS